MPASERIAPSACACRTNPSRRCTSACLACGAEVPASAAALLTRPVGADATYELTGPSAPTHDEVAAEVTRASGRAVRYVDLSVEEAAVHLEKRGMPAQTARDLAELMAQIGDGRWAGTTTTVADILGREPRSLREFLG
ncbi:hypothetical protein [Microbispora sp. ATCC PTA-5024]|uniref:hypothetical protein n=1 Tax=Microbispora sp. ATCC PTA-5024 TaxID=316330 RepID=UPI0003DCA58D|nr:hypothetical protein [Microbispora sp. ATCC PTA-5024]ETK37126.1 hypothetical protein MPTA5024_05590 [Microbispora sp. ATCC PTA-5024]